MEVEKNKFHAYVHDWFGKIFKAIYPDHISGLKKVWMNANFQE